MNMNINGITALVTLDVFNTFSDLLDARIKDIQQNQNRRIYIGDCMVYTTQMLMNYGVSPDNDFAETLFEIVKNVLSLCFIRCGETGIAEWSDDLNYVILT